jgi:hypothetical protein
MPTANEDPELWGVVGLFPGNIMQSLRLPFPLLPESFSRLHSCSLVSYFAGSANV